MGLLTERTQFMHKVWNTPIAELIDFLFPGLPEDEKIAIVQPLKQFEPEQLRKLRMGYAHEVLGVPERFCKALYECGLFQPGGFMRLCNDGLTSFQSQNGSLILLPVKIPQHDSISRLFRPRSWIDLGASNDEDPNDKLAAQLSNVRRLYDREELNLIYGMRSLLKIVTSKFVQELDCVLVDTDYLLGTFYFVSKEAGAESSTSSLDWSKVLWVLQAADMEYVEAAGRMIHATRKIFMHQPQREFAYGAIVGFNYMNVHRFKAGGFTVDEGTGITPTKLLPDYVLETIFNVNNPKGGGFLGLLQLIFAPATVHGFCATRSISCEICIAGGSERCIEGKLESSVDRNVIEDEMHSQLGAAAAAAPTTATV